MISYPTPCGGEESLLLFCTMTEEVVKAPDRKAGGFERNVG